MDFYRDITFVAPTASLTNFPALVRIRNDQMKKRISSTYGYDVAFKQNNTNLPFELDYYDSTTGSGAWWVQIPSLPTGSSTTIRMVYGDSSITTNQSSPSTVWSGYEYVYHFADLNNMASSVGNYTITQSGTVSFADVSLVSNVLTGRGMRYLVTSGYGDNVACLNLSGHLETRSFTMTLWGTTNVIPTQSSFVRARSGWWNYGILLSSGNLTHYAGAAEKTVALTSTGGLYVYGAGTQGDNMTWVLNGVAQDTSGCSTNWARWDDASMIMTGTSVASPTEFIFDELRFSTTTYRSQDWMLYEQNQVIHHNDYTT
ncbi:MAG: DUF2341 domain-containing protein, partial [Thermoguttaceae bacterium]|nr:DUF2341 domain-containing protein [Thermoguttaceae bacterium]